jgi:hypothetical protein
MKRRVLRHIGAAPVPTWTCPDCGHSWWNHGPAIRALTFGLGRAGCALCKCTASRPPEPDFAEPEAADQVTCGECGASAPRGTTTCKSCGACWQVVDVDFAKLEARVLAADAKREPVERMTFAELYGGNGKVVPAPTEKYDSLPPVERRAWRRGVLRDGEAEVVRQARAEGWITDELTEQHIFFVRVARKELQPARQFAVLLAQQLCAGNPLQSFVDELTAAIERRDADVVRATKAAQR